MKKAIISFIIIMLLFTACSSKVITVDNPNKKLTMTELNVCLSDLKNDISEFILKTYMPKEGINKEDYIQDIVKYLSESEYNSLLRDIGDYNNAVETRVKDLKVRYSLAENNSDNCDKIICCFYLNKFANGITVRNRINIVFTIQGNMIVSHSIFVGDLEKRG